MAARSNDEKLPLGQEQRSSELDLPHSSFRSPPLSLNVAVTFTALDLPVIMTKATSLYAPSVYNGTGAETKLNLVLSVADTVRDEVAAVEAQLNLGPGSCSVLKNGSLKVKIDMGRVSVYDEDHQSIKPLVALFAGAEVEVRLELRGTWKTASSSGLSIRCTDVRFCSGGKPSPFQRD